jgi:transcriptional regulator with XRE-family HTH domain
MKIVPWSDEKMDDLRELRRRRGLTLEAMGLLAGVDAATISRLERGTTKARLETTIKLARALGISAKRMAHILASGGDRQ